MSSKKLVPPLEFKSDRLVLRPLKISDYESWIAGYKSLLPKQTEFDESFILRSDCKKENFKKLVTFFNNNIKKGEIYQLFAFDKSSSIIIGSAQYSLVQRYESQRAYLGYSVLNNHWERGYGFELANAMIDHAFKKVKLHRLEAEILPHNKISIKLSKKLGMSCEGIRKKCLYVNGEWKDHKVYAITAEDRGIFNMKPNKRFL